MSDITAVQLEAARQMKIAALSGEKRFIDHANELYWSRGVIHNEMYNPLASADYDRRQVRLQAVQRELKELHLAPPTAQVSDPV
jgi:hypothetical protein